MRNRTKYPSDWLLYTLLIVLLIAAVLAGIKFQSMQTQAETKQTTQSIAPNPVPVLAYFYIWYDNSSWNRAKIDTPLLGTYSSDDATVMRQQIQEAKAAGINGFIVSWKSTDVLNRRLNQLAQISQEENFKLAIIYQGLDFNRDPLPATQVANDLDYFIQNFASMPAFQLYSKPLVIWSGTWKFSTQDIDQITRSRLGALLILASERDVQGINRLANLVDGDAYYWSSVNPATFKGYLAKLSQMSELVHKYGGMWIAPAAPGFDARLIGGSTIVDRNNGDTFRTEINTAMASSPDALGIISWNEFSENSYIEPSQTYGSQYLDVLSHVLKVPSPNIAEFDSSLPDHVFSEVVPGSRVIALGGFVGVIIVSLVLMMRRSNRKI